MQTITIGRATYKVINAAKFLAEHAKCTGKHKRQKSKGSEKRAFPKDGHLMSTADYVSQYEKMNKNPRFITSYVKAWGWQTLTEHVTQPQGQDIFEVEA